MLKVVRLPGVGLTPKILLANQLEHADDIESVVMIIKWKSDKSLVSAWTDMKIGDLALASAVIQREVLREMVE